MTSLETARKLKEAGLQWEPQLGDWAYNIDGKTELIDEILLLGVLKYEVRPDACFAPRLDQLLAEIEKRGWAWDAESQEDNRHYSVGVRQGNSNIFNRTWANTPEEAAAAALLWIIEQGTSL